MHAWIVLLALLCSLWPTFAENRTEPPATEINSQELEASKELLFQTEYLKKMLIQLKKDHVRWFYINYRDGDMIVFEFRDKREDLDHYPYISRFAVNPQTRECFEQRGDYEKIH